jgi:NAD(P)-dependent dehydrogenase (short-subunit alcohol dehydrogenase family)
MADTVFITGADKGLGLALAARFLEGGFHVFAGCLGRGENLRPLAARAPDRLTIVPQDVTDPASVRRSAQEVGRAADHLDVLINNAGITLKAAHALLPNLDLGDGHLEAMMNVNAFGPLRVVQALLPLLEKGRRKRILTVTSEAGSIGQCCRESWFGYSMSKAAANMQCQILQRWLGPKGFKVLAIQPGWMRTDMGGPDADIAPEVSAAGLFVLATRDWPPDAPVYVDYTGKPLPW